MARAAPWHVDDAVGTLEPHGYRLCLAADSRAVDGEVQVRQRRVAGVTGQAYALAACHAVARFDECAIPLQMIVLTRCAVTVQYDDVVRITSATFFPAAPFVRFDYAGHDAGTGRMHRCAFGHVEINREFLASAVAET